jgi:hypothetical protein
VRMGDGMNSPAMAVRRYYASQVTAQTYERVALVGMTGIAGAPGSVHLGLRRPRGLDLAPLGDLDEALERVLAGGEP